MVTCYKVVILAGGCMAYGFSFLLLLLRIRACSVALPPWTDILCTCQVVSDCSKALLKKRKAEMVRQLSDFVILLAVMFSGAFSEWLCLFGGDFWGGLAGFSFLISFSLILSIGVDWFLFRWAGRSALRDRAAKIRFLQQEIMSILLIDVGITIVLGCLWFMERLQADAPVTVAAALFSLMLYRALFLFLRNTPKHFQELPESELSTMLMNLLDGKEFHPDRILIRFGNGAADKYVIRMHGMIRRNLVLDRGIICSLKETEICAYVGHWLEMRKSRMHVWKGLMRGLQGVAVLLCAIQLVRQMEDYSSGDPVIRMTAVEIWRMILPVVLAFAATGLLQMIRNAGMRRIMIRADRQVAEDGSGDALRNALILTAGIENLHTGPLLEMLYSRPGFLPDRIPEIERYMRAGKEPEERRTDRGMPA